MQALSARHLCQNVDKFVFSLITISYRSNNLTLRPAFPLPYFAIPLSECGESHPLVRHSLFYVVKCTICDVKRTNYVVKCAIYVVNLESWTKTIIFAYGLINFFIMAKYIKKEIADLNNTGTTHAYYKMQTWRKLNHNEFVDKCAHSGSGVNRAMVDAVLTVVSEELPRLLAEGFSVQLDNIGTFYAKLGMKEDKEQDSFETGEQKHNAQSISVNGIGFRADKSLIYKTDRECDLERGGESRLRVSKYSLEERIALAKSYLEQNAFMRVADYAGLTGLSQSKASIELRQICVQPDTPIQAQGRGSHRIYVKGE